jgi:hypothetical protein
VIGFRLTPGSVENQHYRPVLSLIIIRGERPLNAVEILAFDGEAGARKQLTARYIGIPLLTRDSLRLRLFVGAIGRSFPAAG